MTEPLLLINLDSSVLRLTLNRQGKKNALSSDLMHELLEALRSVPAHIRIVLLEGKGSFFCAGLDLEEALENSNGIKLLAEVFQALKDLSAITIAKVQGGALAGGLGLVAACDLAFASSEALFSLPELKRGLVPALVYTLLNDQIPKRSLNELVLITKPITAEKAHLIGLVHEVVPLAELDSFCDDQVHQILKNAPLATKMYKKMYMQMKGLEEGLEEALNVHQGIHALDEVKEGICAFLEKRAPKWDPTSS